VTVAEIGAALDLPGLPDGVLAGGTDPAARYPDPATIHRRPALFILPIRATLRLPGRRSRRKRSQSLSSASTGASHCLTGESIMSLRRDLRIPIAMAVLACAALASAQGPAPRVDIPSSGKTIESFVPRNYRILEQHEADLNGDGLRDAVLVVEFDDDVLAFENPRPLLILFRQRGGGYRLSARSDDVVYTASPGVHGDSFYGIDIVGRTVVVKDGELSGAGSEGGGQHQKFRFQNGGWYRIGIDDHEWRYPPDGDAAKGAASKRTEWCPELKLSADEVCLEVRRSWNYNTGEFVSRWDIYPVAVPFDMSDDALRIQIIRGKIPPKPLVPLADPLPPG
jgi:hypothetical protein